MLGAAMNGTALRLLVCLALVSLSLSACGGELPSLRELAGLPKDPDPSVEIKAAEPKWLLIKNPRFGDVASEPEYIWVEEDKIPTTMGTLVFGKSSLIAPGNRGQVRLACRSRQHQPATEEGTLGSSTAIILQANR